MTAEPKFAAPASQKPGLIFALCVGLILLSLAAYWGVWRNDFVNLDDDSYVVLNDHVNHGLNAGAIKWAFTRVHASNWHSLTWLSHALDCSVFGLNPAGHHVTALIIHALNGVLLFLALHVMTGAVWRSAIVAALFAVHPLHVESVAWISERKDVLSAFFFFLSLMAYTRFVRSKAELTAPKGQIYKWYFAALLAFVCGLLSKPMLVTLPFVLLLLDIWPLQRIGKTGAKIEFSKTLPLVWEKIPFFILTIAASWLTTYAQKGTMLDSRILSLEDRLATASSAYVAYLQQTIWPAKMAAFYPHPLKIPASETILAVVILAGFTWAAFIIARQRRFTLVGWLWYVGMLVPVIGIVQVGAQSRADRYTYLPSIGIFIILVWGVAWLCKDRSSWKWPSAFATIATLTALCVVANRQVQHWRNSETLFSHAAAVTHENYMALGGLAIIDIKRGAINEGFAKLQRALAAEQYYVVSDTLKFNFGMALQLQGRGLEALPYLQESHVVRELAPDRHYRLALSLIEANRLDEAENELTQALASRPNDPEFMLGIAVLRSSQNRQQEAEKIFQDVLTANPKLIQPHRSYADFLLVQKRVSEAEQQMKEVVNLLETSPSPAPDKAGASVRLADLLSARGNNVEAISYYEKALAAEPNLLAALNNLAWLLSTSPDDRVRNGKRAVELAERAVKLTEGKTAVLLGTLAAAYAEAGQFDDAAKKAEQARDLARAGKQEELAKKNEEFLELYRAGKAYREAIK